MMFQRILVFADGRAAADRALAAASELTHWGTAVIDRHDIPVMYARASDAVTVAEIESRKPDLIVSASEAGGRVPRWLRPDPTNAIVAAGLSPVMHLPHIGSNGTANTTLLGRDVLCVVDGSTRDDATLAVARRMALTQRGDLVLAQAVVPPVIPPELPYGFDFDFTACWDPTRDLADAEAHLQDLLKRAHLLAADTPVRTLARLGWLPDLIAAVDSTFADQGQGRRSRPVVVVAADHARSNLLGISVQGILRSMACPVVVVPALETVDGRRGITARRRISCAASGAS